MGNSDKELRLLGTLLTAIFTANVLGFLLIFGPLRRFTRSSFCNLCLFGAYMAVAPLINNILGKFDLSSLPAYYQEDFWLFVRIAMYLLILYGGQDNINALSLQDNDSHKRYTVEVILMNVFFVNLVAQLFVNHQTQGQKFSWDIALLWLAMFLKLDERKWAFFYASNFGIAQVCRVFADYMKTEHIDQTTNQRNNDFDPHNLKGYKYLLEQSTKKPQIISPSCQVEIKLEKAVTLYEVWNCEGELISVYDRNGHLKDLGLSYSLFWLLLRRFAGFTLYETTIREAREKTWRLIRDGLVDKVEKDQVERVFRVIEIELMFLYDFFYTKYYAAFNGGIYQFLKRCFISLNIIGISTWLNSKIAHSKQYNIDSMVLFVVMIVATVLEIIQVFLMITSKWCIVKAICYYVKKEIWNTRWSWFFELSVKILNLVPTLKPWRKKLGQYSLLDSYGYDPTIYRFARCWIRPLVEIPRPGQTLSDSTKLSVEVKVALLSALQIDDPKLSNGVESLQRNEVPMQLLSWACELETQAHVILVWHIATSFCEKKLSHIPKKRQDRIYKNYKIAKDLSMYCAYLVAFAPDLLRDHVHVTKAVFDQVIVEAKQFFSETNCCGCNTAANTIDKMDGVSDEEPSLKTNNIERGTLLGKRLMSNIRDEEKRWKVLAEFWAELVLFLAPSNQYMGHAKYLVKGGELMTILWALLTHAGIIGIDSDFKISSKIADAERSQV